MQPCRERPHQERELALGRVAGHHGLQHLDVRCAVEVLADGAEERPDRRRGAVRLQGVSVGPLLDEHERPVGLVQGIQLAAGLLVHRRDGLFACVPYGVDGLGFGLHGGDDDDRALVCHGAGTPR